jgi:hypothetical protein
MKDNSWANAQLLLWNLFSRLTLMSWKKSWRFSKTTWSIGDKSATYKRKGRGNCPSVYELKSTKSAPRYIIS